MKLLVTGRDGQVGAELVHALAALGEVIATDRAALDLADPEAIRRVLRETKPEVIVNAAAYTAVDRAEAEAGLALKINGDAPGLLAEEARRLGALLVHYSTDYVFDGEKAAPYVEDDPTHPLGVYGRTKLAGERAIAASGARHLILRTSWVYGARGRNFLMAILARARSGQPLRVVADQVGAPTSSAAIARATAELLKIVAGFSGAEGLYHFTAAGETSWHGFAQAIVAGAGLKVDVAPIATSEYPTAARRPKNSRLDNGKLARAFGLRLPDWRSQLDEVMRQLPG
ncbi:MAG: dTDP-4-dehydrorhamnose reductase [Betaproteobacteria bacterium]|nr:dTDP-4-dehydrorhamnose reductase [Betaproteobacteria bacterium]